jgi:hypothetical protein
MMVQVNTVSYRHAEHVNILEHTHYIICENNEQWTAFTGPVLYSTTPAAISSQS